MVNEILQFKNGNPVSSPEERIDLLPKTIWKNNKKCVALDIGCNAGNLTQSLHVFLKNNVSEDCSLLGVDIDPILIRRANEANTSDNVYFQCLDFMDQNNRETIIKNYLLLNNTDIFSVVFCFSTTMWIHLNNGDMGLKTFLKEAALISDMLIIEPQPWKCYKAAVKRLKKVFRFPLFSELKIRENVEDEIEKFLIDECNMVKIAVTNRTKWDRKIIFFEKLLVTSTLSAILCKKINFEVADSDS
ncbi:hypothetical protein NQ317_008136 [Molorchus minor]|uniref:RNA methyltransferase n=1 Tax=Molorchus minor TaxID=1323400 RepID=A0ABQ9IU15_9CUCU|nr:hypothetical protein NQ317_008136 [Molorchus minor]